MNNQLTPTPISIHFSVDSPSGSPFERVQHYVRKEDILMKEADEITAMIQDENRTPASTVETIPETKPIIEETNTIVDKTPDTECCVCYNDFGAFHFKTHCNHNLCIECILQLPKPECPMCRSAFPESLKKLLPLKDDDDDEDNRESERGNNITIEQTQEDYVQMTVIEAVPEPQPIPSYGFAWSGTPANY
jgi:hypothetical protein